MSFVKKTIKWMLLILTLAVYVGGTAILISDRDPALAKYAVWTEQALSVYRADPDSFSIYQIKVNPNYTSDGNFFCSNVRYSPTVHQLTLTVRFNKSTLKHCMQDFDLSVEPGWDCFVYTLKGADGTVYGDSHYIHFIKGRHHYVRIVFDGVDLESQNELTLCAQYRGSKTDDPYGTILLYQEGTVMSDYHLKKKEIPDAAQNCTPDMFTPDHDIQGDS